jgi:murein L,D-transpeptidase YafK
MRYFIIIIGIFISNICLGNEINIDSVLVKKTERKMYLLSNGNVLKEYDVVFGNNPKGHKQQEGDEKTPEGKYTLDYKKINSSFYKSIHISYPNKEDIATAKAIGVSPGGQIMIHGQKNGFAWLSWLTQHFNWTNGCIAVNNSAMEEIWQLVKVGIPIEIMP